MPLLKSEKAKAELAAKQRTLSVRERSALFLADGIRSCDELVHLLQGDIGMLQKLMESGYLLASETLGAKAALMTDFAMSQHAPNSVTAAFSPTLPQAGFASFAKPHQLGEFGRRGTDAVAPFRRLLT